MIGWKRRSFDKTCDRWFESSGGGYSEQRSATANQDADDLEIARFNEQQPEAEVRESFLQFKWSKDGTVAYDVFIYLAEYDGGEMNTFRFSVENATQQEQKELKLAVRDWHATGILKYGRFSCMPCWGLL